MSMLWSRPPSKSIIGSRNITAPTRRAWRKCSSSSAKPATCCKFAATRLPPPSKRRRQPHGHHAGAAQQPHEFGGIGAIDDRESPDVVLDHFRRRVVEQLVFIGNDQPLAADVAHRRVVVIALEGPHEVATG